MKENRAIKARKVNEDILPRIDQKQMTVKIQFRWKEKSGERVICIYYCVYLLLGLPWA